MIRMDSCVRKKMVSFSLKKHYWDLWIKSNQPTESHIKKKIKSKLTIVGFEKQMPFSLHCAFSPQLSDFIVTFNRTHCGPHRSETTVKLEKKYKWYRIIIMTLNHRKALSKMPMGLIRYKIRIFDIILKYIWNTNQSIGWHLPLDLYHKVWQAFCHLQSMALYPIESLQLHHNVRVRVL